LLLLFILILFIIEDELNNFKKETADKLKRGEYSQKLDYRNIDPIETFPRGKYGDDDLDDDDYKITSAERKYNNKYDISKVDYYKNIDYNRVLERSLYLYKNK